MIFIIFAFVFSQCVGKLGLKISISIIVMKDCLMVFKLFPVPCSLHMARIEMD